MPYIIYQILETRRSKEGFCSLAVREHDSADSLILEVKPPEQGDNKFQLFYFVK